LDKQEKEHTDLIENDEEKGKAELKIRELEKSLTILKIEVETSASTNEKLRL
jgi:hypothetical protein